VTYVDVSAYNIIVEGSTPWRSPLLVRYVIETSEHRIWLARQAILRCVWQPTRFCRMHVKNSGQSLCFQTAVAQKSFGK